jgi:glutathione synthase
MKILVQMDDISSINIEKDSTFAIMFAAQNKGFEIFYYLPHELNLNLSKNKLTAKVKKLYLENKIKNHYKILEEKESDLENFDLILVRQDPPFDMNYITSTYLLERIKNKVLILNDPSEIRNCPEKIFIADFPSLIAPTIITCSLEEIKNFQQEYKNIILKPLYSCGGDGVFLIKENDPNLSSIFEIMIKSYGKNLIAQKFLPEVKNGDKRIILIDGQPVGAVTRMAQNGNIRSNFHAGGKAIKSILSKREKEICKKIGGELKKRNLFFVGIDVIGDYLTEINVTSPTGIQEIKKLSNIDIAEIFIQKVLLKIKGKKYGRVIKSRVIKSK